METRIVILLALFATARSTQWRDELESQCTELVRRESRIKGGQEAPLHAFPFQAAIYYNDQDRYFGGALITDRWVITTAFVATRTTSTKPTVILGAQFLQNKKELGQQRIETDSILVHELWDNFRLNDIALLRMSRPAKLNRYVNPIMLAPFNAADFDGSRLAMSGYGSTTSGTTTNGLRYVLVDGVSSSDCKELRGDNVNEGTMCVETTGGKGGCRYDAGDPLMDVDTGLLVGLLSLYDCNETDLPDVFTKVSRFNKWILELVD